MQEIKLNKFFYPLHAIQNTAKAFAEFADIEIEDSEKYHVIKLKEKVQVETDRLRKEFSNYCLMLSKRDINTTAFRRAE